MSRRIIIGMVVLVAAACSTGGLRQPEDDRWRRLRAQWESVEAIRSAHPIPETGRREQIEALVERQRRLEPLYGPFITALKKYIEQSPDPRAVSLYTRERALMGDEYADYLARYDRAIEVYQEALEVDPDNDALLRRVEIARERLYISPRHFNRVETGMPDGEIVELIGYPRIDWVRETVRNGRVYSVWIYPKENGGAAAVYFDNGVVYHKNWDAARDSDGS